MFEPPEADNIASLDAGATLIAAEAAQAAVDAGEAAKLALAAHWASLHDTVAEPEHVLDGTERLVALGGEGTPLVAEFCPLELGCVLGLSRASATVLVADALDLQHRLPKTWARVASGQAKAWVARRLAQATRNETAETAALVDARVSKWVHKLGWGRLEKIVTAAVTEADPAAAQSAADAKEAETGVWLRPSNDHGVKDITIRALARDAIWFDSTVDRVADALALLGADGPKDVLRGVPGRPRLG